MGKWGRVQRELDDLRWENDRLRSKNKALGILASSRTGTPSRECLASYIAWELGPRTFCGVEGIAYDVLGILHSASDLYGKEAVRKALDLDD